MSIAATPDPTKWGRTEYKAVVEILSWAHDFGLVDMYVGDDGEFYFTSVVEACDKAHCGTACQKPRKPRGLTGLLQRLRG